MTIPELISQANAAGITLEVHDGNLKVSGKKSSLDPQFIAELKQHKSRLIEFFAAQELCHYYPASSGQRRLWLAGSRAGDTNIFNITVCCKVAGSVSTHELAKAFESLVRRHEILRTGLELINGQLQQVVYPFNTVQVPLVDCRFENAGSDLVNRALDDARYSFDLKRPPLFRAMMYGTDADETVLLIVFHHSIIDAWSIPLFLRELMLGYLSQYENLPVLVSQYHHYVDWMNTAAETAEFALSMQYWKKQFEDGVPVLDMPLDFVREHVKNKTASFCSRYIDAPTYTLFRKELSSRGITPFAGVLSCVYLLLYKYSKNTDIVIGTAVGGRPDLRFNNLIGFFVNTLPLRVKLDSTMSVGDLLDTVKQVVLGALTHSLYPFDKIVEDLQLGYTPGRHPLYDVVAVFQNQEAASTIIPQGNAGQAVSVFDLGFRSITTDLRIEFNEYQDGLQISIDYDTSLFRKERIELIACHLENLIKQITQTPPGLPLSELCFLSEREERIISELSSVSPEPFVGNINEYFHFSAKKFHESIAISADTDLTYARLSEEVNKLAHHLTTEFNVGRGTIVAVFIPASSFSVISMLAIWKCGGIYLPIDPTMPQKRISYILSDAGAAAVITDSSHFMRLSDASLPMMAIDLALDNLSNENFCVHSDVKPDDIAYIIYTSGSTGHPKGVMVHHAGCLNMALGQIRKFQIDPHADRVALFASISFDASVSEMLMALLCGATLVVVPEELKRDAGKVFGFLRERVVTTLTLPASYLRVVRKSDLSFLKKLILAGEALYYEDLFEIANHIDVFNAYGPTETSVCATIYRVSNRANGTGRVPIGTPLENVGIAILDGKFSAVPLGVAGQLCVLGEGVSKGYRNNKKLTDERFVIYRGNTRLYLTGDVAMINMDGQVEYLGRLDDQLKVNGFRIEPDEIANCINQFPTVKNSVVLFLESTKELLAFYSSASEISPDELKSFLSLRLPHYMVPNRFIIAETLPTTPSGKVDKKQLLEKFQASLRISSDSSRSVSQHLRPLAQIWQTVLGRVVVDDLADFFALGGDSIKAIQVTTLVNETYQIEMDITDLFGAPKISQFFSTIESKATTRTKRTIPILPKRDYYELSEGQARLWAMHRIDSVKYAYNLPVVYEIVGPFDIDLLIASLKKLTARHEALRSVVKVVDGRPYLSILEPEDSLVDVDYLDLSAVEQNEEKQQQIIDREAIFVFDLEKGPLWRACVITLSDNRHVLSINMHHIIGDAWSFEIFIRELIVLYNSALANSEATLPELPLTYKDVSAHRLRKTDELKVSRDYWITKFKTLPEPLRLKSDFPRPSYKSYRGAYSKAFIGLELLQELRKFSSMREMSLYPVLLSSVNALLYIYSDQHDIVLGMPFSGRDSKEVQSIIGFFVNTVPVRTSFQKNWALDQLVLEVNRNYLEAYQHQYYGFHQLINDLNLPRNPVRYPLFDVWVVLHNVETNKENLNLPFNVRQMDFAFDICKYDLKFDFVFQESGGEVYISFSTDLFTKGTIERMCADFMRIVSELVSDPSQSIEQLRLKLINARAMEPDSKKIKKRHL